MNSIVDQIISNNPQAVAENLTQMGVFVNDRSPEFLKSIIAKEVNTRSDWKAFLTEALDILIDPNGAYADDLSNLVYHSGIGSLVFTMASLEDDTSLTPKNRSITPINWSGISTSLRAIIPLVIVIGGLAALFYLLKKLFND
jgi:hypothetical protein